MCRENSGDLQIGVAAANAAADDNHNLGEHTLKQVNAFPVFVVACGSVKTVLFAVHLQISQIQVPYCGCHICKYFIACVMC